MRSCPTDYVDSFSSQAWSAICPNNRCLAKFSPTCPSTLFISSWSEDPLSADGFQAVGQLEQGSCNGQEGMATALQCNPLNNHPFKVLFFLFSKQQQVTSYLGFRSSLPCVTSASRTFHSLCPKFADLRASAKSPLPIPSQKAIQCGSI